MNRYDYQDDLITGLTQVPLVWNAHRGNSSSQPEGTVNYLVNTGGSPDVENSVAALYFSIPDQAVVDRMALYLRVTEEATVGGTLKNATIYLNPTKTKTEAATGLYIYRFSGGTTLRSGYSLSGVSEDIEVEFTESQIRDLNDGGNLIVVQENTSASDGTNAGLVSMNLIAWVSVERRVFYGD